MRRPREKLGKRRRWKKKVVFFPAKRKRVNTFLLCSGKRREKENNFQGARRVMAAFPPDLPQLLAEVEDYASTVG
jgi:hypothetical protein